MATVATYSVGAALHPPIHHDNGFLEKFPARAPTAGDRAKYAEWGALLEGAEAAQGVPLIPHNNLPDALAAYRHFLSGKGTDRTFSYERYVAGDKSGKLTLENAILDFRRGVEELAKARPIGAPLMFQVTGTGIPCGSDDPDLGDLFPYPATENWQKAIGAHFIWLSGSVTVGSSAGQPTYVASMTLHAEDRYNFNPGAEDIKTGIPDAANGRFEVSGLAKQYMNYSTLTRFLRWTGVTAEPTAVSRIAEKRERKPQDNRRARNRI
ncbi:MAG TPA: hypothetical protein VH374_12610 [Polyangia bacterium]|jgi:hypothetical protein|nr:hypothetical protein [Polyangia bacterium]